MDLALNNLQRLICHKTKKKPSTDVMVRKLDYQTFMSEFESHWVHNSYGKKLSKLIKLVRMVKFKFLVQFSVDHLSQLLLLLLLLLLFSSGLTDDFLLESATSDLMPSLHRFFLPDDCRVKTAWNHWLQISFHAIKYR